MSGGRARVLSRSSVAALAVALTLSGCSSGVGSTLGQSVSQAGSAAETARSALAGSAAGRLPSGVAKTAFEDMQSEAEDAESSGLGASPATASQRALRGRVVATLHATVLAVVAAADAAEGTPGAPSAASALRNLNGVIGRLQSFERQLGSGR